MSTATKQVFSATTAQSARPSAHGLNVSLEDMLTAKNMAERTLEQEPFKRNIEKAVNQALEVALSMTNATRKTYAVVVTPAVVQAANAEAKRISEDTPFERNIKEAVNAIFEGVMVLKEAPKKQDFKLSDAKAAFFVKPAGKIDTDKVDAVPSKDFAAPAA